MVEPTCGQRSKNCSTSRMTSVVLRDHYHPVFRVPEHIRTLHPDLYLCAILAVVTDPPIALPSATPFLPTSHHGIKTSTAEPGLPVDLVPIRTGTPLKQTTRPDPPKQSTNLGPPSTKQKGPAFDPPDPPIITTRPLGFPFDPPSNGNGGGMIIDPGTIIQKGGAAATIGDATIRVGDSGISVSDKSGTRVIEIPKGEGDGNGDPYTPNQIISINGHSYIVDAAGNLVKLPTTLQADPGTIIQKGGPAATIGDTIISVGNSSITVSDSHGTRILEIPKGEDIGNGDPSVPNQIISIGGHSYMLDAAGNLVKLVTAVYAGNADDADFIVSGTAFSVGSDGRATIAGAGEQTRRSRTGTATRRDGGREDGTTNPTNTKTRGAASMRVELVGTWWVLLSAAVILMMLL